MKRAQWHAPAGSEGSALHAPSTEAVAVVHALEEALRRAEQRQWTLAVEQQRMAGRSRMFLVRGTDHDESRRWIVKQPHTDWTQDDLGSPLTAAQEFAALKQLEAHFSARPSTYRVPAPVALLPTVDAFAMEYIAGPNLKELLTYRSLIRPAPLLGGLEEAGRFLRELHRLEELPPVVVDLKIEAEAVLAVTAAKLHPLGLDLPESLRRTLARVGSQQVEARQVWLHGDFGPANILLARDGSIVGIDASLDTVGQPEDDLVRFVALVSGIIRLAPEVVVPPFAHVRRELEARLLRSYYGSDTWPALFHLRYLHQLARRWCRLRELAEQHERPGLRRSKLAVISRQVRLLMLDSERRLLGSLGSLP